MKKCQEIFREGDHYWAAIARDPERPDYLIDTCEYLIGDGATTQMTDPGGTEIFPAVFSAVCEYEDPEKLKLLFASHQDPDVVSSLSLWLAFNPDIKCYLSWLWGSFVPHFGGDDSNLVCIPDEGMAIQAGKLALQAVPAHYLHSSGNFHLYDAKARILFSGDVGAALLPESGSSLFVQDFDRHIRYIEGFHRRWMGSRAAVLDWCERAGKMQIDMLCPQHGAIYQGEDVMRFINWLAELPVGNGMITSQRR